MSKINNSFKAAKKDTEFINQIIGHEPELGSYIKAFFPKREIKILVGSMYGGWLIAKDRYQEYADIPS